MPGHPAGDVLAEPLDLPCGQRLANRLVKAAMSDALGDGTGRPTGAQIALYRRWAGGGAAASIIGEVQVDPRFPESPGNLVLVVDGDRAPFRRLAAAGSEGGSRLWAQLGHAGALANAAVARPAGPSALDVDGLRCRELSGAEVRALPARYAAAARQAADDGFAGVQVHAGHGFLLSQFLSPLFNRRTDGWGGSIEARCRVLVEIVRAVRAAVGDEFAVSLKINSSDELEGGLTEDDSLVAIEMLGAESVDLIDISGGTYFPGAPSSSDRLGSGAYFAGFARRARGVTAVPLMVTGGVKTRDEAVELVASGAADVVGLARAFVIDPELPVHWLGPDPVDPTFPRFAARVPGGVTAWYTMRIADLASGVERESDRSLDESVEELRRGEERQAARWLAAFGGPLRNR